MGGQWPWGAAGPAGSPGPGVPRAEVAALAALSLVPQLLPQPIDGGLPVCSALPPHSQNLLQAAIDASNLLQPVISHARQSF